MILNIIFLIYMISCTISDVKTKTINLPLSTLFLLIGITIHISTDSLCAFVINLIPAICLFGIFLLNKSLLGIGDIFMVFVLCSYFTLTDSFSIILFSFLFCSIVAVLFLALRKWNRKTSVPYAPFLLLGYIVFLTLNYF